MKVGYHLCICRVSSQILDNSGIMPCKSLMVRVKPTAGEIELDLGRYELRRFGRRVKLEKKSMELLIFLASRREQLVSRQDIVSKLWHTNLFIDTERNINNIVRKIRAALGDNVAKPRFLETVVGKGYRFIGPLRIIDARHSPSELGESQSHWEAPIIGPASWRGERTSLAVLPPFLLGDATDDKGLCLGFADSLVSSLGNMPGVDVLPTSAILNVPVDAPACDIASRLGVRFVVHGAVGVTKGQSRISVEMFDTHLQRACFTRNCDFNLDHMFDIENEIVKQVARVLNRPFRPRAVQSRARYSRDPLAYTEFMRGYRLSSSGDPCLLEDATQHLVNAVTRDPAFSLAHAILAFVCATRHFEFDPSRTWLEKAEFHCRRALEADPDLPEGRIANAFLLWGPSKNFQHVEAIAELKRALRLQNNLPHAYNRLGTILAHIGLLDHAREMYHRGKPFHPRKEVSHSIVQVYLWNGEYERAREEAHKWRAENPANKYPVYFALQLAMLIGYGKEARTFLEEATQLLPEEPLIISLQGVFCALAGNAKQALECLTRACAIPKSFGHAHHTYYQIACILSVLKQPKTAFEWLERSVDAGFACWPFFLRDPWLQDLRGLSEFEVLISGLQAKYPDHLGLL
jgi:DNA-binding winged helix-turn-helix (wHTH) protein/TolB-like protein/tetratricopeptide (TPR) repeat protein